MGNKIVSNSKLIIYNIDDIDKEKQLTEFCRRLGYNVRKIKNSEADTCVGTLAGIKVPNTVPKKEKAPEGYKIPELIIFSGISDGDLDGFLAEYKSAGILPVALKAVVTPHNVSWSVYELARELQRERIAMMFGKR